MFSVVYYRLQPVGTGCIQFKPLSREREDGRLLFTTCPRRCLATLWGILTGCRAWSDSKGIDNGSAANNENPNAFVNVQPRGRVEKRERSGFSITSGNPS